MWHGSCMAAPVHHVRTCAKREHPQRPRRTRAVPLVPLVPLSSFWGTGGYPPSSGTPRPTHIRGCRSRGTSWTDARPTRAVGVSSAWTAWTTTGRDGLARLLIAIRRRSRSQHIPGRSRSQHVTRSSGPNTRTPDTRPRAGHTRTPAHARGWVSRPRDGPRTPPTGSRPPRGLDADDGARRRSDGYAWIWMRLNSVRRVSVRGRNNESNTHASMVSVSP